MYFRVSFMLIVLVVNIFLFSELQCFLLAFCLLGEVEFREDVLFVQKNLPSFTNKWPIFDYLLQHFFFFLPLNLMESPAF